MEPDEIYADYTFWRHEGLNPIATVETYAALMLDERLGELNDKQKEWLKVILRNSKEARKRWDDFGAYLQARHALPQNTELPASLAEAIQRSLTSTLERYKYFALPEAVKIKIPASLQAIKIDPEFESVFFYLLAPAFKLMDASEPMPKTLPQITASPKDAETISIHIRSAVEHFHIPTGEWRDFSYSNIDIALAHFILKQKGIALNVKIVRGEYKAVTIVDFSFDLPILQDSAS